MAVSCTGCALYVETELGQDVEPRAGTSMLARVSELKSTMRQTTYVPTKTPIASRTVP